MKILEIYEKKIKVNLNGIVQWLTHEELNSIIEKHNIKIDKAKKEMTNYLKEYENKLKWIVKNKNKWTKEQYYKIINEMVW